MNKTLKVVYIKDDKPAVDKRIWARNSEGEGGWEYQYLDKLNHTQIPMRILWIDPTAEIKYGDKAVISSTNHIYILR